MPLTNTTPVPTVSPVPTTTQYMTTTLSSGYPKSFATPNPDQIPTPIDGAATPSHGGTVTSGHEYDMPVLQSQTAQPRSTPSTRPRPVSMPPQSYAAQVQAQEERDFRERERDRDRDRDREKERERERRHAHAPSRSSRSNRILGDYTLSKTLGAGSMGKVKLATHNVTGEQVCFASLVFSQPTNIASARSKNIAQSQSRCSSFNQRYGTRLYRRRPASFKRCLERNPDSSRSCIIHAPSPSIHLRYA